jgi:AcrR family transcriptional regulator
VNNLSLRERNKQDKLLRIKTAAKQLFDEEGFDVATTRNIAKRAGVALATLFLYATDKRDLLFLVCNDDLDQLAHDAFNDIPPDAQLIDQLTVAFRHFFIYYAKNKQFSRDLLRELTFYNTGINSERFHDIREKNIEQIRKILCAAKQSGLISTVFDESTTAKMIFYLFAAEVRRWLSVKDATPEAGVQDLRSMLDTLITGLNPSK